MIYRVEVSGKDGQDGVGVTAAAVEAGVSARTVRASRVFFVESTDPREAVEAKALPLLGDPVVEEARVVTGGDAGGGDGGGGRLEIHLKPGVMDPVAASAELALRQAGLHVSAVRTGRAFVFDPAPTPDQLKYLGGRVLGNSVIEAVHLDRWLPAEFPRPRVAPFELRHVRIRDLDDEELLRLSRDGHLFLNLAEMKAIQTWYREQHREPTDVELETLAQTWSEHCVHKTLKSAVSVTDPVGGDRSYANLIKETIFESTQRLMREGLGDFCLSVFKDNAGVIAFDAEHAVCIKVETHNRPSAIDPYGGAATGVGGCIRDVIGTGLGAKPIANTDVFCVAEPGHWAQGNTGNEAMRPSGNEGKAGTQAAPSLPHSLSASLPASLPPGVLHPKRTLTQVVAGVRDYGNRMGIPTVNGAVYFDDRYVANPLVFCGCIGLLPRDRIHKAAHAGDAVVVVGGRTGRDGIHGATFSSAELTSTHADEFSHAVQIGNAITQKKMMDVVLKASVKRLFSAITDCGAGGLSSAVGEMGEKLGAEVHLDRVPLKYEGLRYDEIWISEAQERMVLAVPPTHVQELLDLAKSEDVDATVLGHFGTDDRSLRLYYHGTKVADMAMHFLHDGIPMPTRKAVVEARGQGSGDGGQGWWGEIANRSGVKSKIADLLSLLSHPNIASKQFIVRQYDHEVQGMSVVKPFVGPAQRGPSDAAVLKPKPGVARGVAVGCGLCPWVEDPYEMALLAIDEAVRNVVATGADPARCAILDNFCWPGTDNERAMGDLVRTAEACRDAALAYRVPFISGKDSLHNQYTDKTTGKVTRIPNTLLVTAMAIVEDAARCVTMDLKRPGAGLYLASAAADTLAGRIAAHRAVHALISAGKVHACHDVSDGGWLTAVAEMCIGSGLGADLTDTAAAFDALVASYVVELPDGVTPPAGLTLRKLGTVSRNPALRLPGEEVTVRKLTDAWTSPLAW